MFEGENHFVSEDRRMQDSSFEEKQKALERNSTNSCFLNEAQRAGLKKLSLESKEDNFVRTENHNGLSSSAAEEKLHSHSLRSADGENEKKQDSFLQGIENFHSRGESGDEETQEETCKEQSRSRDEQFLSSATEDKSVQDSDDSENDIDYDEDDNDDDVSRNSGIAIQTIAHQNLLSLQENQNSFIKTKNHSDEVFASKRDINAIASIASDAVDNSNGSQKRKSLRLEASAASSCTRINVTQQKRVSRKKQKKSIAAKTSVCTGESKGGGGGGGGGVAAANLSAQEDAMKENAFIPFRSKNVYRLGRYIFPGNYVLNMPDSREQFLLNLEHGYI